MEAQATNLESTIPSVLPANGQDWANYIAHYWSSCVNIQAVLAFNSKLDYKCLANAVRLTLDAEPVLGCRFVEQPQPYWLRLGDVNHKAWCLCENTADRESAVRNYLTSALPAKDQQIQVKLIHAAEGDTVCIKLNHACADGGGLQEYVQLLASVYSQLCADSTYRPIVNAHGERSANAVFRALEIKDPRIALNPALASGQPSWTFPYHDGGATTLCIAKRTLNATQFGAMRTIARALGASVNDLVLTAYYRALFSLLKPAPNVPADIHVTVDLRRYLPGRKAGAICNLSGIINAKLPMLLSESPVDTLRRVAVMMRELKATTPGLHSAATMEMLGRMQFGDAVTLLSKAWQKTIENRRAAPLLSNFRVLANYPLRFGTHAVERAYMVSPAIQPPGFMLGVSTYHDELTLTVSYLEPATHPADVECFMDILLNELLGFI